MADRVRSRTGASLRILLALAALALPARLGAALERAGDELVLSESGARFPSGPAAAFAGDGTFVVVWSEREADGTSLTVGRRFDDSGSPLGAAFPIGVPEPGTEPLFPRIVALPQGGFAVAWVATRESESPTLRLRLLDREGDPQGDETVIGPRVAGESLVQNQGGQWIAATAAGEVVVVWEGEWMFNLVEGQRVSDQGQPRGSRFVISTATGRVTQASVAPTAGGGYAVAWIQLDAQTIRENATVVRVYSSKHRPLGPEIPVTRDAPNVALHLPAVIGRSDGSFAVIVRRQRANRNLGLSVSYFDAAGRSIGGEARLDGTGGHEIQGGPTAAASHDGHLLVAWNQKGGAAVDGIDVVAGVLGPDGRPAGAPFLVNTKTPDSQVNAAVATGPDGAALVVWVDNPAQGDWSIRGQLFRLTR